MMLLSSPAFQEGDIIPKEFTAEGSNYSPPLTWSGIPTHTRELALICDDPDAPRTEAFVHWVLYGLDPTMNGLPAGIPSGMRNIRGALHAMQGLNSKGKIGYFGPLPPIGRGEHRYFFKLYALDAPLNDLVGEVTKETLLNAMKGHIISQIQLMGRYERKLRESANPIAA